VNGSSGRQARRAIEAGRAIGAASFSSGEMFVLHQQVTLSQDTLATVWHRENLGVLHNTLAGVAYWHDDEGQRDALNRASGELAQQGLLAGRDLDPDFRDTLNLLARPSVEYYGWISTTDGETTTHLSVLLAGTDQDAIMVVREGDKIQLSAARPDGLAETLVGMTPPVQPARARSVNLPEAEISQLAAQREASGKPLPDSAFSVFHRASMVDDAKELFATAELPRIGGGQLYVAARDRYGERRRCPQPLLYIDTRQGRWMTQRSGAPGEQWIVSAPASRQLLISRLHEMRNALTG
jgi:hypothetical protein